MTNYVCSELAPAQSGYVACKTWVAYEPPTDWVDKLAIISTQMAVIGIPIVTSFGIILAYTIIAKGIRVL